MEMRPLLPEHSRFRADQWRNPNLERSVPGTLKISIDQGWDRCTQPVGSRGAERRQGGCMGTRLYRTADISKVSIFRDLGREAPEHLGAAPLSPSQTIVSGRGLGQQDGCWVENARTRVVWSRTWLTYGYPNVQMKDMICSEGMEETSM